MNQNPYAAPQTPLENHGSPAPKMTIWKLLFSFKGRINRARYWAGTLLGYGVLVGIVFAIDFVEEPPVTDYSSESLPIELSENGDVEYLMTEEESVSDSSLLVVLVLLVPFFWVILAVQVKRWHDRGKSGWMCLIAIIPFGGLWIFIECGCLSGNPGVNRYGPDPLS